MHISTLIQGSPGQGKTTAAASSPGPILWADADHSTQFIENKTMLSITRGDAMPTGLSPDTIVTVQIDEWADWRFVVETLLSGNHEFETGVLDPLPRIQRVLKEAIRGTQTLGKGFNKSTFDTWDQVLHFMEVDIDGLNKMKNHPTKKNINVVVCSDSDREEPYRCDLQGQLKANLPSWFDLIGYMSIVEGVNEDGEAVRQYGMDISSGAGVIAEVKCKIPSVQRRFGKRIDEFTFDAVFSTIDLAAAQAAKKADQS